MFMVWMRVIGTAGAWLRYGGFTEEIAACVAEELEAGYGLLDGYRVETRVTVELTLD